MTVNRRSVGSLDELIEIVKREVYTDAYQIVRASATLQAAEETLKARAQSCGVAGVRMPKASGQ